MAGGYEYKVIEVRDGAILEKTSGKKLEKVFNEFGSQGWRLKAITPVDATARLGSAGIGTVLVTFERLAH